MTEEPEPTAVTLVARLSGPLQSWGEHSPFTHRNSLPYPTLSGLLGLLRASLGISRLADPETWAWLRDLGQLVRVDRPGSMLSDYHTVNPPRAGSWDTALGNRVAFTVPRGELGAGNRPQPWEIKGTPSTAETHRTYLTDAAFTWLVTAPPEVIDQISQALRRPVWQISAGRKACLLDWPTVLGISTDPIDHLLSSIPAVTGDPPGNQATLDVHQLHSRSPIDPHHPRVRHFDNPVGSHPHDGYRPLTRIIYQTTAPTGDRQALADWTRNHLDVR